MISIVIPVFNEEANIEPLYKEVTAVLKKLKHPYEILFINDGSTDQTAQQVERLCKKDADHVKTIEFRQQVGKAAALDIGFKTATGDIIITLDGDLQDDPSEIPNFLNKLDAGYDLVSGWKQNRKDSFIKNNTSKIFNAVTNLISEAKLHDFNCGFKAYRREVVEQLNLYGELHRYIPVIAASKGFKISEIPVHHRIRHSGKSKYGPIRFLNGALDLATVLFITKYHSRPLHFFGYIGMIFFGIGSLLFTYLLEVKFVEQQSIGDRPLLLFSIMLMIIGVQIGVTGLVGEQITLNNFKPQTPNIKKSHNTSKR